MSCILWLLLIGVLKSYLVLDLAPYPVFGSYTHMLLQSLGYTGDYREDPAYLDSLANYRVVFLFSEANNPQDPDLRWRFTREDISKLKTFLDLPDRGLIVQGYFCWTAEPGSPELCYLMGVKPDSFVMWSWWEIFNFEYGSGTPLNISTMPWLIMTLEPYPNRNKSEPFIRSRRPRNNESSYMFSGIYGKVGCSKTVALGFIGASLWNNAYRPLLKYLMLYMGIRGKDNISLIDQKRFLPPLMK